MYQISCGVYDQWENDDSECVGYNRDQGPWHFFDGESANGRKQTYDVLQANWRRATQSRDEHAGGDYVDGSYTN